MLSEAPSQFFGSIERSQRETNVKIKSLLRLLEALDTAEEVLSRALDKFQGNGANKPSPLTKDIIEPSSLGIHFTYFKDFPLTKSSYLVKRIQTETEDELLALQKKKRRLEKCQGSIKVEKDHGYQVRKERFKLPKIEEDCLCTPIIRLGKVRRGKNGLFQLTEEYTYMGELEVPNTINKSKTCNYREKKEGRRKEVKSKLELNNLSKLPVEVSTTFQNSPNSKDSDEDLWSDIIDINEMEKLNGMDPKTRGDYTAQFYKDLFKESDWLITSKTKDICPKALVTAEKKKTSSDSKLPRNKGRRVFNGPSSELARLFSGRKSCTQTRRGKKVQTQRAEQSQEHFKEHLNQSKRVLPRRQRVQQESDISKEDVFFSPLTGVVLD